MKFRLLFALGGALAFSCLSSCVVTETGGAYGGGGYVPGAYGGGGHRPAYGAPPQPVYGGGYGYGAPLELRRREAYRLGRKVGADDYYAGRKKQYGRHSGLYDSSTESAFKEGHYSGYEEARERDKKRR